MSQIDMPFIAINNKGLEVKNITKSYSKKKILDNVSLNLDRGESVALLGPNGAGKTSLFYIVMGLIKSDSGSIIINNDNISELPMYRRSKLGLGYLPQESSIFRGMNVEQNILAVLEKTKKTNEEKNKTLESTISSINGSILEIGFDNTANLYSISDSAKVGGKIGWIDENSLSSNLINSLKSLKKGQYSKPISLSSKFIILKINDIKKEKKMIDKDKELKKLILSEENRQLNNFSKIYFDKLKINTKINEF